MKEDDAELQILSEWVDWRAVNGLLLQRVGTTLLRSEQSLLAAE